MKRLICLLVLTFAANAALSQGHIAPPAGPIPPYYFGLHIHHAASGTPWPSIPFHCWRLWDAGVSWEKLEPQRGVWNFDLLDKYIQFAQEHDVEVLLTLGQTPTWASSRPQDVVDTPHGNGANAKPANLNDWDDYVSTVAERYKGKIQDYEIWNEPDQWHWWSGDIPTLVEMTRRARNIVRSIDPSARIVSPSVTAGGRPWLSEYLDDGGGEYIDVVGFHFYVAPKGPEQLLIAVPKVRNIMIDHGLQGMPLWDTEEGWGGSRTTFANTQEMAAYVSRALIMNWAAGVRRFFFYAYDNYDWSAIHMIDRTTKEPTEAATAYTTTESWLINATMNSCTENSEGIFLCAMSRGSSHYWIVWSTAPGGRRSYEMPGGIRISTVTDLNGNATAVENRTVEVAGGPVMVQ